MSEPPYPSADWQILDAGSIWMREFAAAMSKRAATVAWAPSFSRIGHWKHLERTEQIEEPRLALTSFPLQRGYARLPIGKLLRFENKLLPRLEAHSDRERPSKLVCSTPFYAPVAERWTGPVIYYVTDLTKSYTGIDNRQVIALDQRMCKIASLVCPNSRRIADYLMTEAGCGQAKIAIIPNATRASNIPPRPLFEANALPAVIAHLKRPIAGVIGNLAANMDWLLLKESVFKTTDISWVFVGPTAMPIKDRTQSAARRWVMQHAHFTGPMPYGELQSYARSFNVAVLPYRKHEPTYSGSSTRFYEHLPACRPMIGTRGFAELLEKQPLITLVDTAAELTQAINQLRLSGFQDGLEESRWRASYSGTWEQRAQQMIDAYESISAEALALSPV